MAAKKHGRLFNVLFRRKCLVKEVSDGPEAPRVCQTERSDASWSKLTCLSLARRQHKLLVIYEKPNHVESFERSRKRAKSKIARKVGRSENPAQSWHLRNPAQIRRIEIPRKVGGSKNRAKIGPKQARWEVVKQDQKQPFGTSNLRLGRTVYEGFESCDEPVAAILPMGSLVEREPEGGFTDDPPSEPDLNSLEDGLYMQSRYLSARGNRKYENIRWIETAFWSLIKLPDSALTLQKIGQTAETGCYHLIQTKDEVSVTTRLLAHSSGYGHLQQTPFPACVWNTQASPFSGL
ncbi:hypothetical protein B0H13DRAFT_1852429 [Mycena leptocephala]|nr:hypothetical protein B0H13DRAFT_1852429 [Mycena leptocephala]